MGSRVIIILIYTEIKIFFCFIYLFIYLYKIIIIINNNKKIKKRSLWSNKQFSDRTISKSLSSVCLNHEYNRKKKERDDFFNGFFVKKIGLKT